MAALFARARVHDVALPLPSTMTPLHYMDKKRHSWVPLIKLRSSTA